MHGVKHPPSDRLGKHRFPGRVELWAAEAGEAREFVPGPGYGQEQGEAQLRVGRLRVTQDTKNIDLEGMTWVTS